MFIALHDRAYADKLAEKLGARKDIRSMLLLSEKGSLDSAELESGSMRGQLGRAVSRRMRLLEETVAMEGGWRGSRRPAGRGGAEAPAAPGARAERPQVDMVFD